MCARTRIYNNMSVSILDVYKNIINDDRAGDLLCRIC